MCEAQSIAEVKSVILTCKPDLVTMDMTLSDGDGIEATKLILNHCQNSKVMAISAMMDAEIIKKAKDAGVKFYIQKGCSVRYYRMLQPICHYINVTPC